MAAASARIRTLSMHSSDAISRPPPAGRRTIYVRLDPGMMGLLRRTFHERATAATAAILIAVAPGLAIPGELRSQYEVKAALLVTFLKFVERESGAPAASEIVIGIVGEDPFGRIFEPIRGKPIMGRKLDVLPVEASDGARLKSCDLVFVSTSGRAEVSQVLEALAGSPTLTVGEVPGFLEDGGVINFVLTPAGNEFEVGYEINQQAAHDRGLRIDTNVLQRAVRVIKKGS